MANEAVKVELYDRSTGSQRRYLVASAVAIAKGTLLCLSNPRTAAAASGTKTAPLPAAGIASMAKASDDFSTSISAWTNGIFELKASGAIAVGQPIVFTGQNEVFRPGSQGASGAMIAGYALETAADGDTINVRVLL